MQKHAWVFVGTETTESSEGIYAARLNQDSGELGSPMLVAATDGPTFLATDPEQQFLFCTGKPPQPGVPFNTVSAYTIDRVHGTLAPINSQQVPEMACCHISTSLGGRVLFAVDYSNAKAATFPVGQDGRIEPPTDLLIYDTATQAVPDRQQAPHVHSINPDVSNRYVLVCDFSADAIKTYELNAGTKVLTFVSATPTATGAGPRHLTCHPNGKWVYAIHELNGTVALLDFDNTTGSLETRQTISSLPEGFAAQNTTAEIALSPDLRFLYGSNRGHDSLAYYEVDPETGLLSRQGIVSTEGTHPRNFSITPTGHHLLVSNRDSDNVVVFRLDRETGKPEYTGHQLEISRPMCLQIMR
ncbi:MAG: lactonase family protein [Verrucomicrobia bacterium]|jgi:6-phosphogluconolactonase|nr:lactonase family protein [Verrucomicrobiota bacterium]